jgi:hypothetical protein
MDFRTTRILASFEAAPPVTFATLSCIRDERGGRAIISCQFSAGPCEKKKLSLSLSLSLSHPRQLHLEVIELLHELRLGPLPQLMSPDLDHVTS